MWGIIAFALFSEKRGVLYGHENSASFLGTQCLGILVIASWSSFLSGIYFSISKKLNFIRLSDVDELLGGDIHYFAPIDMEGTIASYAKGLQLTKLNSEQVQGRKSI